MNKFLIRILLGVLLLVLASCGDDVSDATTTTTDGASTTSPPAASTTSTIAGETTTTAAGGSSSTSSTTSTTEAVTTTTLPGEPFDIVPADGTLMAVVGVEFDDVLNVRAGPGTNFEIIATLPPEGTMLSAGEARLLPQSIWYRVSTGSTTGWVSSSFTGQLGLVDDVTSQIVANLGEIPVADTMLELGRIAADARASIEPPSRITVTVAPTVGDLGEVTYDVVGIGDDAVLGERLHVFGQSEDGGATWSLKSVEAQVLCGRGVTSDGLCV